MYTVGGAAILVASCIAFWRLLPRKGQVHPILKTSDISSMVTIGLMTTFTAGTALLLAGVFG